MTRPVTATLSGSLWVVEDYGCIRVKVGGAGPRDSPEEYLIAGCGGA